MAPILRSNWLKSSKLSMKRVPALEFEVLVLMQNMIEKILRMKIYDSTYWKEHCFALTAEAVVDKAVAINSLGGTFGGARKPTKFVCLLLKLLQLQPDKEIIIEFIKNEDYKYVRVLGRYAAKHWLFVVKDACIQYQVL